MDISTEDYEKMGCFYLGREFDPEKKELQNQLALYDSKDLVTHGAVLGMTGSGKTGLCLSILEEAAMDGIPAIVIDPKGDIPNLLLTFPEFQGQDFRPWINEEDARKKGLSPDEYAQKTAQKWKDGIASWGQSPERVKQLREKVGMTVFTPGSTAGIPVSILSSLEAPPIEIAEDREMLGDRVESTVSSLLSLVGEESDPIQSPAAVLLAAIFNHAWANNTSLGLESLIRSIQSPAFDKVGVIDLESFYPAKDRQKLALKFNNLLASPAFATWLEGPPLDIQRMLYDEAGKPQISIFSIAHLNDAERMFFVSLLLNQMLAWMRQQSGTTSLRALLYMDEIYGFLPPTSMPPSKKPLLTMLKQARAFGLGVLVATQNPVDLDYRALSNIGTWWLGRLQTERDKHRVLNGLEGAMGDADQEFDRKEIEGLLSGMESRIFLMNNVHEDAPKLFHVRWVMSYLRGPLTRGQIKLLMDKVRDKFLSPKTPPPANTNPMSRASATKPAAINRPIVGHGIEELFVPLSEKESETNYQPALLREATVHFTDKKSGLNQKRQIRFINPIKTEGITWEENLECPVPLPRMEKKPAPEIPFQELPGYAMNADNYKPLAKEFADWLYRNERAEVLHSKEFGLYSTPPQSEGDFRAELSVRLRELKDEAKEELREKFEKKIEAKILQQRKAQQALDKEKAESSTATFEAGAKVLGGLLSAFLGKSKSRISKTNTSRTINSATKAYKQRRDVSLAKEKIALLEEEVQSLEEDLKEGLEKIAQAHDPQTTPIESVLIDPYKKNIEVEKVALLWLPSHC